MKILHLVPYNPVNPSFGGALRVYHVLKHLLANYDVTIAGFGTKEQEELLVEEFPELKGQTLFIDHRYDGLNRELAKLKTVFMNKSSWRIVTESSEFEEKIDQLFQKEQFDLSISEFPVMEMYSSKHNVKRIVNCHNVEYDNFRRMTIASNPLRRWFYKHQAKIFFHEETHTLNRQDALLVTSERDIQELERTVPDTPKYLVPNGVDTEFFTPKENVTNPHSLVFVGMMQYLPNVDGIEFFLEEVFPLVLEKYPDCKVTIIGKNPPESVTSLKSENVEFTGFVDDTRPYIDKAAVYIVPLRMGGGTRLKVMEAMAMKKAVVSTSIGCEGIDVSHGENILIEDQPKDFANAICTLFENYELRNRLKDNGYKLVHQKYDWKSVCSEIDTAIKHLFSTEHEKPAQAPEQVTIA